MAVFARLINLCQSLIHSFGVLLTTSMLLGCCLIISLFTPLYSSAVLWLLNQVVLPPTARLKQPPTAIVVLGGGLTNSPQNDIIINKYTQARLKKVAEQYHTYHLPIVASGKEAPWMMTWLQRQNIWWVVPEKNSFNTCENAKFTAQTLYISDVILVTDAYHMNRARRQFALNQIATMAVEAPLPQAKSWTMPASNLQHSRRASYELLAFARDVLQPQIDCQSQKT